MHDWRWMAGDGSWQMEYNRSPFLYEATKFQTRVDLQTYGVALAWLPRVRRHPYSEHYSRYNSEILNHAHICPSSNAEYDPESHPTGQLQCRYRTSRTRLIFGAATIFKKGDNNAGIATTPTANYHTGTAGTKHLETHSPIQKASNGEC
jgi:hypothetical protein